MTVVAHFTPTSEANDTPDHIRAVGWVVSHPPTIAAYERHSGESIAPALTRFIRWAEANIIGGAK